jgi:hypothetical protein
MRGLSALLGLDAADEKKSSGGGSFGGEAAAVETRLARLFFADVLADVGGADGRCVTPLSQNRA